MHKWNPSLGMATARILSFHVYHMPQVSEREVNPGEASRQRSVLSCMCCTMQGFPGFLQK